MTRTLKALFVPLVLAGVVVAGVSCGGASAHSSPKAAIRAATVPPAGAAGGRWVKFRSGQAGGGKAWEAFLYRPRASFGRRSICLSGSIVGGGVPSVLAGGPACHLVGGGDDFWRLAIGIGLGGPGTRILAFAFPSAAKRVDMIRSSGIVDDVKVQRLDKAQSGRLDVSRLGYVVVRDRPFDCYEAMRTLGRNGQVLGHTLLAPC